MLTLEDLVELWKAHPEAASTTVRGFAIAGRPFSFHARPSIMGVINLSPDSWYRESVCLTADQAVARAKVLQAQGADIIDLGAESSLAHADRIDVAGQQSKLLPVLRQCREEGMVVSVETYEADVARVCLEAGAAVLNLTGLEQAKKIYPLVKEHDAALILCHVQGPNVREVGDFDFGKDPTEMFYEFFSRETERAVRAGVEKIFIDPGLGFYYRNLKDSALRVRHQMQTFLTTFRLRRLGFPVCHALPHAFEFFGEEVRCAEPFFAVLAALGQTDLFRTHEVSKVKAVLDTLAVYER